MSADTTAYAFERRPTIPLLKSFSRRRNSLGAASFWLREATLTRAHENLGPMNRLRDIDARRWRLSANCAFLELLLSELLGLRRQLAVELSARKSLDSSGHDPIRGAARHRSVASRRSGRLRFEGAAHARPR